MPLCNYSVEQRNCGDYQCFWWPPTHPPDHIGDGEAAKMKETRQEADEKHKDLKRKGTYKLSIWRRKEQQQMSGVRVRVGRK
jgi:hypothetical protein